ncbi:MAG: AAA family ATPase, partial [Paramuribaculum sp.]|nr:AAA family ATPase [Paramuribaculum sp.]
MLEYLKISNYALIDRIDIRFESGLNIITGETGAGKSIILGALGLLLGGRADQRVISNPEAKTIVEAHFNVAATRLVEDFCSANDIEPSLSPLIIRRELSAGGRSRAFI